MKKKAIIFGGSSGIGFFFTKELINRGYNVTVISSDIVKLKKAKKIIKQEMSSNIDIYELDLLNQKKLNNFLIRIKKDKKKYNFVLYSAGSGFYGNFENSDFGQINQVILLNILSYTKIMNFFVGHFKKHKKKSHIVSIGSLAGFVPNPKLLVYGTSKKFIETFSIALREDLKYSNISVSLIAPGQTDTNFIKNGNFKKLNKDSMSPKEVVDKSIKKIFKDKKIIIPGFLNILRFYFFKIIPNWITYIIYKIK